MTSKKVDILSEGLGGLGGLGFRGGFGGYGVEV